ncbi:MAG: 5-(carboxyamino)imidazole ribonucleotide synthase [Alphaproteobacteria bacterium]|nr:5-(carboxyamino)imidazole ribonucleotide synthase [Alphaproteobacteria bacterium]MBV9862094.1 5-(carboxyamino)imidazole ribonucleotide synthase [Alphaproteobacteria bacterium]
MLAPGATIGILGGGQLGRMTALAAARLGYRCHVYAVAPDSPAAQVAAAATVGSFEDTAALDRFAAAIDVATFEFENIPSAAVRRVAAATTVSPRPEVLEISQDRLREKDFLRSIDVATTGYREVSDAAALARAMRDFGYRAVLKSVRMGYDGKGQVSLTPDLTAEEAWRRMGGDIGILEAFVDFAYEISVIVVRGAIGAWATYPPVENHHVNHILDTTIAPARIMPETAMRAEAIARHVAERLDLVGVLAVEMFVTEGGELLVNELAPRPHNSGHWTVDACYTSQFEQLVRAICGHPLGSTERHSDAVMKNLVGRDVEKWRDALNDPLTKLHLYGKAEVKPGRKMGHVTRLHPHR